MMRSERSAVIFSVILASFLAVVYSVGLQAQQRRVLSVGLVLHHDDHLSRDLVEVVVANINEELAEYNYALQVKTLTILDGEDQNPVARIGTLLRGGVVAVMDLAGRQHSRLVSAMCSEHEVPHLLTSCGSQPPPKVYSMDLRPGPGCTQYVRRAGEYLSSLAPQEEWTAVYSDGYGLFPAIPWKTSTVKWVHKDPVHNSHMLQQLRDSKTAGRFFVDMPHWQIADFMALAAAQNMTTRYSVFLFTDWDSNLQDVLGEARLNLLSTVHKANQRQPTNLRKLYKGFKFIEDMNGHEGSPRRDEVLYLMPRHAFILDSTNLLFDSLSLLTQSESIPGTDKRSLALSLFRTMETKASRGLDDVTFDQRPLVKRLHSAVFESRKFRLEKASSGSEGTLLEIVHKRVKRSNGEKPSKTLRVTTILVNPFVIYKDGNQVSNYDSDINAWDGFCIDLLKEIGNDLDLSFAVHLVADGHYGTVVKHPNGTETWIGMIGEVLSDKADLILAPLTISYDRERVIDFTTPFMNLGQCVLVFRPEETSSLTYIWVFIVLLYIGLGLVTCFISHFLPFERIERSSAGDNTKTTSRSIWFRLAPVRRQGGCPQAVSMRSISIIWWILSALVICIYIVCLAAFLKGTKFDAPIQTVEDLAKQTSVQYGILKGGASEAFFKGSPIQTFQRMYRFMKGNPGSFVSSIEEGVARVRSSKGKFAFILESKMAEYYAIRDCSLVHLADLMDSRGYGIGLPNGSPLRENITRSINKLQKSQTTQILAYKWWHEINNTQSCTTKPRNKDDYLVFGIGLVITAFLVLVELYVLFRHRQYDLNAQFHKYLFSELHSVLHMDKDPKTGNVNIKDTVTFRYTVGDPNSPMCSVAGKGASDH